MIGFFNQSKRSDEDFLTRKIEEIVLEKVRNGFDPARVDELLDRAVPELIEKLASKLAVELMKDKRFLRASSKGDRDFDRRLRKRWKRALDLYSVTQMACSELGEKASSKRRVNITPAHEYALEALTRLHASACRVAGEVLTLLAHGHPRGALARCRTLHETAVIACVISDSIVDPDNNDLAERFLNHEVIGLRRDALQFQKDHVALGEEPLEQVYLDEIEARYNEVLDKYGASFKREYGWAKKFCPDDNLRALEEKASLEHARPHYQWASSEVHCGARGLGHNFVEYRGMIVREAGKINTGLVDPAGMALNSLLQVTFSLTVGGDPSAASVESVLCMRAVDEIRSACIDAFRSVQGEIDRDEKKILNRMRES
ncbi:DUF5677 domain-containing protein [[Kitasatospora] papulosa]|uniref:DUF5677 domain-containing protein n=1 Tax=Streptomyces TaxID=1883 RepID=UPI003630A8AC